MNRLFAVYLGGKCKGAVIEMHDVVFVTGPNIEATFPKLRKAWFGIKSSAHVDSWTELTHVDGYKVILGKSAKRASPTAPRLFFVNIGSYAKNAFGERHTFHFMVCASADEAKARAKTMFTDKEVQPHVDNRLEIDTLLEITEVEGLSVSLKKDPRSKPLIIENGYWPIKI